MQGVRGNECARAVQSGISSAHRQARSLARSLAPQHPRSLTPPVLSLPCSLSLSLSLARPAPPNSHPFSLPSSSLPRSLAPSLPRSLAAVSVTTPASRRGRARRSLAAAVRRASPAPETAATHFQSQKSLPRMA
eukprot:2870534-Rhodomonas_salina.4